MRGPDFISNYRQATTNWLNALEDLLAYKAQYDALDLGNTLTEEDFATNPDIDRADLVAAVGSVDAIHTVFLSGHNTNLYQIKL